MSKVKKIIEEEMNKICFKRKEDSDGDVYIRRKAFLMKIGIEEDHIYVRSELIEKIVNRCIREYFEPKYNKEIKELLKPPLKKYNESILKELDKNLSKLEK